MEIRKELVAEIVEIIRQSRTNAIRAVDHERVLMYWHIGKKIFEEEQLGQDRADYGTSLIREIASNWSHYLDLDFQKDS